jgi:hypothetical protein
MQRLKNMMLVGANDNVSIRIWGGIVWGVRWGMGLRDVVRDSVRNHVWHNAMTIVRVIGLRHDKLYMEDPS